MFIALLIKIMINIKSIKKKEIMHYTYFSFSATPSNNPSSIQIVKTCEALSRNGNEVELVIPNTGLKQITIKKFYNIENNFKVRIIKFIKTFPIGIKFYFYSFLCLYIALKKKGSISITRNFFLSFLLTLFQKDCILELHHDVKIEGRISKLLVNNTNFLNKSNLKKIVAISNKVKQLYIKKYKADYRKIIVLPSGSFDITKLVKRNKINNHLKIGYFGSLSKSKGIDLIIKLSKLDKKNRYYIYGGKNSDIFKLKLKHNNCKNLFLNCFKPYRYISKLMSEMDIMLMPYEKIVRSAGEVDNIADFTSPLKLFDYLSSGKLIISSNLSVLREVLTIKNCIFIDNFENVYSWLLNIRKIEKQKHKLIIYNKSNYFLAKKYFHTKRVKKYA